MQTRPTALLPLVLATFLLAGCEGGDSPGTEKTSGNEASGPASASTEDSPAAETASEGATRSAGNGAKLSVAQSQEYGDHLADADGRALYLLKADTDGASNCYDACAQAWPPFLAEQGKPSAAGQAIQADMIDTFQREDGSTQVSYNGHPLYYYAEDRGAGQATGQDVTDEWGEWYLVTPEGEALEEHGGE